MSVRMRHTSAHSKNRRSHHALKNTNLVKDKESGALRRPHRIDESTGMYRGKLIKAKRVKVEKAKKSDAKKGAVVHSHEGHEHAVEKTAVKEKPKGILGRMNKERAKARSGTGS